MKTVHEVSELTGLSVRARHHSDSIGLLKPADVTEAGYRLYDDAALSRLQTILLFRELKIPLNEIKEIINNANFDKNTALEQQIRMLELEQKRLGELIAFARKAKTTGGNNMDFTAFDKKEIREYAAKAKEKWGNTDACREYEQKKAGKNDSDYMANAEGLMSIFAEIGKIRSLSPESREAQELIGQLRDFISEHYYTCTTVILRSLGQMYIAGDSMTENIDRAGGEGTAAFANKAIEIYCDAQSV